MSAWYWGSLHPTPLYRGSARFLEAELVGVRDYFFPTLPPIPLAWFGPDNSGLFALLVTPSLQASTRVGSSGDQGSVSQMIKASRAPLPRPILNLSTLERNNFLSFRSKMAGKSSKTPTILQEMTSYWSVWDRDDLVPSLLAKDFPNYKKTLCSSLQGKGKPRIPFRQRSENPKGVGYW